MNFFSTKHELTWQILFRRRESVNTSKLDQPECHFC